MTPTLTAPAPAGAAPSPARALPLLTVPASAIPTSPAADVRRPVLFTGAPEACWLGRYRFPMLVSRNRLVRLKRKFPLAITPWILDSGGFTHLRMNGRWIVSAEQYADEVLKWQETIGGLVAAAPQDWMCEPDVLRLTGKTIREHQELTVANFLRLRELAPTIPWMPVLQGWTLGSYSTHLEMYAKAGVDLHLERRVGVGSICRRQNSVTIAVLLDILAQAGLRNLHGFGVKIRGLELSGDRLFSVDSAAWSYHASRENIRLPECDHAAADCRACPRYAEHWHTDLIERALVTWPEEHHPAHLN
ncbi:hypothetical protein ACIHFD_49140 [Nonomuraea sp. NPDC051941]|uniref:deazapurine DNA modification protein DpdA family protein n=1 Tax=Nonomuraea sp. NPDC051941 TaxID=3364373 RepID=UPI0037C958A3